MFCELLVSFALLAVTVGSVLPVLKRESEWKGRIVGGSVAKLNQFPYQCSLRLNGEHICGGSLIRQRFVLTAAHCTSPFQVNSLSLVVGAQNRTNDGIVYQIASTINHFNYNSVTFENDIALIKTAENIVFNDAVQPIVIDETIIPGGVIATVSGWGLTSYMGLLSNSLMWVDVPTLTNAVCQTRFTTIISLLIFETSLCAGGMTNKGACIGDSGGPLVSDEKLIGLVSWGIPCGAEYPDVYTRLSAYIGWISDNTI